MTTIMLRRGLAREWATANPVLAVGEPGFETDTGKHKIGDGVTSWEGLPSGSPAHYLMAVRRNGGLNVWSITDNVATALGPSLGDTNPIGIAVADGAESGEMRYRVAFASTTIVVTCETTGKSQTFLNNDFAGPFHLSVGGDYDNEGCGGLAYNVVVTESS